jgi:hypothetical protein
MLSPYDSTDPAPPSAAHENVSSTTNAMPRTDGRTEGRTEDEDGRKEGRKEGTKEMRK